MSNPQHIKTVLSSSSYFYEKRYFRPDGRVFVRRYSRSFERGNTVVRYPEPTGSNVLQASASRAKTKVRLLAFSNPQLQGLLTLTFRENIIDESTARKCFDTFRRNVANHHKNWQFLGVKERQKRGSIHYHLLVNFCPSQIPSPNNPNKSICDLWDYGFSDFSLIKGDDLWRTELYLLKYLTKVQTKLFSQWYVRSRNLHEVEPRYYRNPEPMHPLAENIWITSISNKHVDRFEILEYNYLIKHNERNNRAEY